VQKHGEAFVRFNATSEHVSQYVADFVYVEVATVNRVVEDVLMGPLNGQHGSPIVEHDMWSIVFGNDLSNQPSGTMPR
jgi:hypothetical protein